MISHPPNNIQSHPPHNIQYCSRVYGFLKTQGRGIPRGCGLKNVVAIGQHSSPGKSLRMLLCDSLPAPRKYSRKSETMCEAGPGPGRPGQAMGGRAGPWEAGPGHHCCTHDGRPPRPLPTTRARVASCEPCAERAERARREASSE